MFRGGPLTLQTLITGNISRKHSWQQKQIPLKQTTKPEISHKNVKLILCACANQLNVWIHRCVKCNRCSPNAAIWLVNNRCMTNKLWLHQICDVEGAPNTHYTLLIHQAIWSISVDFIHSLTYYIFQGWVSRLDPWTKVSRLAWEQSKYCMFFGGK